jgi:hypothetical protein
MCERYGQISVVVRQSVWCILLDFCGSKPIYNKESLVSGTPLLILAIIVWFLDLVESALSSFFLSILLLPCLQY